MRVRQSVIWSLRGAVLSATVGLLLAAGATSVLAGPPPGGEGAEQAVAPQDVQAGEGRHPAQRRWGRKRPGSAADSFRVQLYATTERGSAESFRARVRQWWASAWRQAPSDVLGADPPLRIEHADPYYRVHLGAFSARDRARRAQSFLQRQYPEAFVVQRAPAAGSLDSAPTAGAEPRSEARFSVQLYATTERGSAESFRVGVRRWWASAWRQAPSGAFGADPPLRIEHGETYYRVRMGAFSDRREARRAQDFLARRYPDAFVTRTGADRESPARSSAGDQPPTPRQTERDRESARRSHGASGSPETENGARPSPAGSWDRIRTAVRLAKTLSRDSVYTSANLAELFEVGCDPALPEQARADALARESSHFGRSLGLEFEARYGQESRAIVDETTGGLSGTYVGLEWDLLGQGLIGNRQRSTLLETRARAARLTGRLAQIQRIETCRARRVQERLRGLVPRLLETQIELAEDRQRLLRRAYLEGEALLDTFLEAKKATEEAKRQLKVLREEIHDEYAPARLNAFPPLPTLDFQALAQARLGDSLRKELGKVQRRVVALEDEATFDTRLSVFSRYAATRTFDDRDVEFGVRLSQPLFGALFGNDGQAEAERTELRRREEERALSEQRETLRTVHRRFEEDQARAVRAHYRVAGRRERVRRHLSQHALRGNGRLNEGLRAAETLIGAMVEKALAYGEVYEEVARAFSAAREPFDPAYLDTYPVTKYEQRGRAGRRALYIWSDEFRRRSNDFIIELARARKIERLIVTAGHNAPMEKVRALQARAREHDIATELLLAANHWVRPGGVKRARTRIKNLDLRGSALHLDVEPHGLDDFNQREDEYLRRYLKVLRAARRLVGDRELVVSVPLFWPDRIYQDIAPIVDRVHFMAYGEKETRQRASQILDVARHVSPEQRVVALRPEDFTDPWALDQTISTLQKVVEADRFALHDLESFLQFIEDES